jgi:hypothetical protein
MTNFDEKFCLNKHDGLYVKSKEIYHASCIYQFKNALIMIKKILFSTCIFLLLLGILACDKNEEITNPDQYPQWLKTKIKELTSESNLCENTDVTIIEFKGDRYYNVYCGLWSCIFCQLFDEKGNHPDWNSDQWEDFHAKKKDIKVLPACP